MCICKVSTSRLCNNVSAAKLADWVTGSQNPGYTPMNIIISITQYQFATLIHTKVVPYDVHATLMILCHCAPLIQQTSMCFLRQILK